MTSGKKRRAPVARNRRLPWILSAVGLLALLGILVTQREWWPGNLPRPARVLLISIDTLRADHLGCYGDASARTPNIDRLSAESVVFDAAATATPLTLPAHSTILTGRIPPHHGVIDNFGFRLEDSETTLAEVLKSHGFATGGFVGAFVLDSRFGLSQGFDDYFDHFDAPSQTHTPLSSHQRPANEVLAPALEWMARQGDRPFFAFVHFYDPHTPYAPPEPYRSEFPADDTGRYDGEVAFVDNEIGKLFDWLKARGLYDDTLVVLLGDHGESLGDHGEATHGLFVYDSTIRVPLLVRAPGARPGRVAAQVRTVDIMPTVEDLLGIPSSSELDGQSLVPLLRDPEADPDLEAYVESHYARLHFGWAPLRGIRTERYKFVDAPVVELYDLQEDPGESRNLASSRAAVVQSFASKVEARKGSSTESHAAAAPVDPDTEQRLRALGYLTARAAPANGTAEPSEKDLPDPKSKIDVFNLVTDAKIASLTGDEDGAATLLNRALEEDPDLLEAYLMLGNMALKNRDYAKAQDVFRQALSRSDANVEASYGLALSYKGLGRLEQAAAGFEHVLELDESQVRALYQLADVRVAEGRSDEARSLLEARLSRKPDPSLRLLLADIYLAQGRRSEAKAELVRAGEEAPRNALVRLSLGNMLLEDGQTDAALATYRKAAELDPESAPVQNAIGAVLARKGDEAGSRRAFEEAVRLDPRFAPAANNLGIALARAGEAEAAEKAFRRALEADPDYAEACNNLGFLYLQRGEAERSVPLFQRALALAPSYAQARENLNEALKRSGRR